MWGSTCNCIQFVYHGTVNYFIFLLKYHIVHFLSTASTTEVTCPPQTVGTTSPPQTVGTTSPPQTVGTTSPPQTVGKNSPPQTVRVIATTGTLPVSNSSTQPTNNPPSDGATTTLVIIVVAVVIILVVIVVGVVILVVLFRAKKRKLQLEFNKIQNVTTEKKEIELKLKQVENTEREANSRPDHSLYHSIAVKQKEVLPSVHTKSEDAKYLNQNCTLSEYKLVTAESEYALPTKPPILANLSNSLLEELESNPMYQSVDQCHYLPSTTNVPQRNDVYTTSSHTNEADSVDHPLYEVSNLLYQSIDQHHDPPSATNVPQGNNIYTVPNTTSSYTNEADSVNQPLYEVSNLLYQSMDQHCDPPSAANVPKGNDIYTDPDTTSSHTVKTQSGPYETMPIQPSLFTDTAGNPSESENLPPHNNPSKEQACWAHNSELPGSNI